MATTPAAHPSPGGQGDGVRCSKCKDRGYLDVDVDVDDSGSSIGNIEACPHCALAARQPVGQEAIGRVLSGDGIRGIEWREGMRPLAGAMLYSAPVYAAPAQAVDLGPSIPSELAAVAAALKRFDECAEDCGREGCDIGRDWFDALTTMGLLKRTQRSPAVWTMTTEGERLLALIDSQAVGNG
ncbi:TPA: hypothetical protein UM348_001042 [Stenotrophomonas maltophilia]|nr:hypothetical protein [Stenotrophomonas sp.]HEL4148342.1 hypothetical protein [Stenotrophomonas maltophilia]